MIDFNNRNTYPDKIKCIDTKEFIDALKQYQNYCKEQEDKKCKPNHTYVNNISEYELIKNQIWESIKNEEVIVYHNTRLTDEDYEDILLNGLKTLDCEQKRILVLKNIKKLMVLNENDIKTFNELYSSSIIYNKKVKEGKICFYHGLNLQMDYIKFAETYGGEFTLWAMGPEEENKSYETIIQALKDIGHPYTVCFKINIEQDLIDKKDYLLHLIIKFLANKEESVDFDSELYRNINPQEIENILLIEEQY